MGQVMNWLEQLPHPDMMGSAEYRAIREVLEEAEDIPHAVSILEEFKSHAEWILEDLARDK